MSLFFDRQGYFAHRAFQQAPWGGWGGVSLDGSVPLLALWGEWVRYWNVVPEAHRQELSKSVKRTIEKIVTLQRVDSLRKYSFSGSVGEGARY